MQESFFMGQGSYGCVYRKQLQCLNKKTKLSKEPRLSKIQRTMKTAEREIAVSAEVRKIPNFQLFFSPVLTHCMTDLAQLSKPDLDKCDFIKAKQPQPQPQPQHQPQPQPQPQPQQDMKLLINNKNNNNINKNPNKNREEGSKGNLRFPLTQTKYIYGESLNKYIKIATTNKNNTCLARKILYINEILTHSVSRLANHRIVHADLNDSNILIDTTDRPIIIDFGLSINLNKALTKDTAKQAFFFYPFTETGSLDSYEPWAPEIAINSFLIAKIGWDTTITDSHIQTLKSVADRYIDGLKLDVTHAKTFTPTEIQLYKTKKHQIIDKFLDKTVKNVVTDLTEASFHLWDIFAIGIMTSKYLNFYCPNAITPDVAQRLKTQILF